MDEALCFGWIDSTVKKLDDDGFAQRFTPRRTGSRISEMNKARARRLVAAPPPLLVPADIRRALHEGPVTWRHFQAFPEA